MPLEILQIVPQLPPAISGVGDYAWLLARELRAAHGIHTRFIVCGHGGGGEPQTELDGFPVCQLSERSGVDLLRELSAEDMPRTVLLHYVGYGYEKRGCPAWLVNALSAWRGESDGMRLVTMFHELYAFGPPWRSAFWTSPIQQRIAARLARLSSACVTNMRRYANWLSARAPQHAGSIKVLPVFSNVGEPAPVLGYDERPARIVVFGAPGWRRQAYTAHRDCLERVCGELGLTELVDIGPACGIVPKLAVRCVQKGSLPADQLSREFLACRAGFFSYPVPYLGKSGIFAAYAAHGLVPVTHPANSEASEDGLQPSRHFLLAALSFAADNEACALVAGNAFHWYGAHRSEVHAAAFQPLIVGAATPDPPADPPKSEALL